MNKQDDNFPSDDELTGAFEVDAADPSEQHMEGLRRQVAMNVSQIQANRPTNLNARGIKHSRPWRFRVPVSLASIVIVALVVLLVARPLVQDTSAGLQNSLSATREAKWIHGSTTIVFNDVTSVAESWCSPARRVAAFRSPRMMHFVDYEKRLQSSYTDQYDKIFEWEADAGMEGVGRQFLNALLNEHDLQSSYPFHNVSEVTKSHVEVEGRTTTQYSFHVELKGRSDVSWETTIQTDPESGRITVWKDDHANGMRVSVEFDYPPTGPRDIYELGAPKTAEIIKIATPNSDVLRTPE